MNPFDGQIPGADPLWDVSRVAAFLGVSKAFVYRHAERGDLPHRTVGNRLRFVPKEIEDWLNEPRRRTERK